MRSRIRASMEERPVSKMCSKCKLSKPLEDFHRDARRADGRQTECKACRTVYSAAYRSANASHMREMTKVWASTHSARVREVRAAYRAAHSHAYREWATSHPLSVRQAQRRWAEANPQKVRELRHRRRVRLRLGFVEKVDTTELYERDGGRCGICGYKVELEAVSIDHIIPIAAGGAHSYSNTRITHLACNLKRKHLGAAQIRLIG